MGTLRQGFVKRLDKCDACHGCPCNDADIEIPSRMLQLGSIAMVGVAVIGSTFVMAKLVNDRRHDEEEEALARGVREKHETSLSMIERTWGLSPREREVAGLLIEGYTNAYIADELGISAGTVKAHVSHIYQKINVHSRDELVASVREIVNDDT